MGTSEPDEPAVTVPDWLDRVRAGLGGGSGLPLTPAEVRLLLDIARVAAHASERKAAPLSTYLVGLALAAVPPEERASRMEALLREVEPRA